MRHEQISPNLDCAAGWQFASDKDKEKALAIFSLLENGTIAWAMGILDLCKNLLLQINIPPKDRV